MQVIMGPAWLAGWHPLPYLWSLSPSLYFPPCFWLPNIKPWFDWITFKKVFFSSVVQYFNQKMLKTRTRSKLLIESPLPQNIYTICQPYQDGGNTCQNHRHNTLLSQLLWKSCSGVLEEMSTPLEQMLTLKQELTLKQVLRCENMKSTYNAVQHTWAPGMLHVPTQCIHPDNTGNQGRLAPSLFFMLCQPASKQRWLGMKRKKTWMGGIWKKTYLSLQ